VRKVVASSEKDYQSAVFGQSAEPLTLMETESAMRAVVVDRSINWFSGGLIEPMIGGRVSVLGVVVEAIAQDTLDPLATTSSANELGTRHAPVRCRGSVASTSRQ